MNHLPIAWTVAGSDSGGGAGVQADLKVFNALEVHGCSVLTALTAQNPNEVNHIEWASEAMMEAQTRTLAKALPPKAIKTGMLGDWRELKRLRKMDAPLVCDPVLVSTSGAKLFRQNTEADYPILEDLFLLTPNLFEAKALLGREASIAKEILDLGPQAALLKGGHARGEFSDDIFASHENSFTLRSPRLPAPGTHGTGCSLASAITAALALGMGLKDALVLGKTYLNRALRLSYRIGDHYGLYHGQWPNHLVPEDMPWVVPESETQNFPDCGKTPLGFYPVVDRAHWVKRLCAIGVSTIQLRVKDLSGADLEKEIQLAIHHASQAQCRLYINDYWDIALKHGAYGVHLGQQDLATADLKALCRAGTRLGVSTHCYFEVATAVGLRPSYIAIGPIFPTTIKAMPYAPQGMEGFNLWKSLVSLPLVAIGGMTAENALPFIRAGASGVAAIRDVTIASDPEARCRQWMALFESR